MKKYINVFQLSIIFLFLFNLNSLLGQCVSDSKNIYAFNYNAKGYEIVKENKIWVDAAACAVERGGYLTEINSSEEQNEIYAQLSTNANIDLNKTVSDDGGGASYVWIGGNDMATEGVWIIDGNNDGSGPQFWQGLSDGSAVNGLYNNWGHEPDNWNNIQDALALALTQWPLSSGSLGRAGQWNDLDQDDSLYYIIEYDSLLDIGDTGDGPVPPLGSGTEQDPYQIASLKDLSWFIQNPLEWNKYFVQTADIDASETATWDDSDDNSDGDKYNDPNDLTMDGNNDGFSPIGNVTVKFSGYYDGNNKIVDGITINRSSMSYLGFFGYVENSDAANIGIKNLGLTNVNISANGYSGGFVGQNYRNTISNCYVKGNVTGSGPDGYLGGFVGFNQEGSVIEKCYAKVNIVSNGIPTGDAFIGGFVGRNRKDAANPIIKECYSSGNVTASGAIRRVGGFAGQNAYAIISNCYSTGKVNYQGFRDDPQAGGFCGRSYSDEIEYCYSVGVFIADSLNDTNERGFIGSTNNDNVYTSNFLDTLASSCIGTKVPGSVTGLSTSEMQTKATFIDAGWDFDNIWRTVGISYPVLISLYIDNDHTAPMPNPMTFEVTPIAAGSSSITMTATTATDSSGVEYFFECTTDSIHSSGWQESPVYEDKGLQPVTEYSYRVKARDLSNYKNETDFSSEFSATTERPVYIEENGICAMEAENAVVSVNGDSTNDNRPMKWYPETVEANYAGSGYMATEDGVAPNATWDNGTELAWEVEITNAGEYFIAVRRIAKTLGDDSGFFGVDGVKKNNDDQNFTGIATVFKWVHGVNSLGTLTAGRHIIQIRRRESGFIVDRVMIAMNENDLPEDGSAIIGPPESLPGVAIPPLTFSEPPHALGNGVISMTALDTTGKVIKYFFECLTDPNHNSGWQVSSTYIDTSLISGTKYVYRVKGMDGNKYETEWSDTSSAVTEGNPPPSYIESNGKCVMEAENALVSSNGDSIGFSSPFDGPLEWFKDTAEPGYAGSGYMTTENGVALNASWENGTELSWAVEISTWGKYYIAIRRNNNNDNTSETAKVGLNGTEIAYSAFWGEVDEFTWVRGPSLGILSEGKHTIQIRRRQDGLMIDRVMIAKSLDDLPEDGSTEIGPPENDVTAIDEKSDLLIGGLPTEYVLNQNYPNPFNPSTYITFSLPKSGLTRLKVYNMLGQEVTTLVNRELSAGYYKYKFDGSGLASGLYIYRIESNGFTQIKKMMLIK